MSKGKIKYAPHGGKYLMTASGTEGYEKLGDQIWPSPGSARQIDDVYERGTGLNAYVQSMNRYVAEQFRLLEADRRRWWDWVVKEYGLDPKRLYQWDPSDHSIKPVPAPTGKKEGK